MTSLRYMDNPRLVWMMTCSLVLAGLIVMVGLFPKWTLPAPGPRPSVPRVMLAGPGKGMARAAAELRAVRSPTMIALAQGLSIPDGTKKLTGTLNPPVSMPELSVGVGGFQSIRAGKPEADNEDVLWRKDLSGAGVSSGMLKIPAFQKKIGTESRGVILEYWGGLEGKRVEVADWSWDCWTQSGVPWALNLDIQADDQGRITHVFLETPVADSARNDELIRSLYQRGRVLPPGPCHGRIGISFAGR